MKLTWRGENVFSKFRLDARLIKEIDKKLLISMILLTLYGIFNIYLCTKGDGLFYAKMYIDDFLKDGSISLMPATEKCSIGFEILISKWYGRKMAASLIYMLVAVF